MTLDALLVALGATNTVLLLLLVVVALRHGVTDPKRLACALRENRALSATLNAVVEQYRRLRTRVSGVRAKQPSTFIVPPPLDLTPPEGDDGETWCEAKHRTEVHPFTLTRPMTPNPDLLRESRPPARRAIPPPRPRTRK
jgi:hypothetical protein